MTPHLRLWLRLRAGVVLAACLTTVAAMLSLAGAPARAEDCFVQAPWTIQVSGPNGVGTTQPPNAMVQLIALDAGGHPVTPVCSGGSLSFTWSVADATGNARMYGWLLDPAGSTASTAAADEGTITYQLVGKAGSVPWGGAPQVTVTYVDPGPSGTTLQASPSAPTANSPVTLTAETTSPAGGVAHWTWDFGDGQTTTSNWDQPSVEHTYAAPGDYTAKVTAIDYLNKSDSAEIPIHVAPDARAPLTAAFSVSPSSPATGQSIAVDGSGSSTDQSGHVTGWSWDFGDGSTGSGKTTTHPYTAAGTYTVTETVTDDLGRTATTTHDVTVHDPVVGGPPNTSGGPQADWTLMTASPVAGALTAFDGTSSTDDGGAIVEYAWKFGDGQTALGAAPRHRFGDGGSYPVTLTVTDDQGRTSSATHQVTVAYAPPVAAFTAAAAPVAGSPVAFDSTGSTSPDGGVLQYAWTFGDGQTATGQAPTHPFAKAGDYDVVLTVTDDAGQTATIHHTVTVAKAAPVAAFPAPAAAMATTPVSFDGTSSSDADGRVQQYVWNFGDGTTGTGSTTAHPYAKAGSFTVTLTVTDDDGLTGTTTRTVEVAGAPPVAAFTAPTGAAGTSTSFDGTGSTDPDGIVRSYLWDFGDGTPLKAGATPGHTFPAAGSYPVTLTVTDDSGLTNSVTHLVTVGGVALPTASFIPATSAPTVGSLVSFDGSRSTAPGGIAAYAWTFGDGQTGTGPTPSHKYLTAGSFPVTLTVTDAAGHTASVTQVVHAQWPATDLAVSVGGSAPKAGQYTYRVTVKNLGGNPAHGIVLTNALDPTQVLASKVSAPTGVSCGGVALGATGTITCKAPSATLAAGKSWVVSFTVKQPATSKVRQVSETSVVRAANPDGVPRNNTARLTTAV